MAQYHNWFPDGVYCHLSNMHCDGCPRYRFYGIHRDTGCKQPEANQALLRAGVKVPASLRYEVNRNKEIRR